MTKTVHGAQGRRYSKRTGRALPPQAGDRYFDEARGRWMIRPRGGGRVVPLHSPEGERASSPREAPGAFDARSALRRAGATVDRAAGVSAAGGAGGAKRLAAELEPPVSNVGNFLIAAFASILGLALLDAALRGRGPAAVETALGFGGGAISKLFSATDPLIGHGDPSAVSGATATASATTAAARGADTASKGKVIGTPGVGTHARGEGPDNWESDNAIDVALPYGTPVRAVRAGTIGSQFGALGSGDPRFAGSRLHLITSGDEFYYAHLSGFAPGIQPGAHVKAGQIIGYSGAANGVNHLHFAERNGNPLRWARLVWQALTGAQA